MVTRDALVLREFALTLFARQAPPPTLVAFASGASDAAWSLLLRAEVCAVPLDRALQRWPDASALPARVRELISRHAEAELQRIVTARWQLARIDALAAHRGMELCVIKGGVLIADDRRGVDVSDIDLVVRPPEVSGVSALLTELGMAPEVGAVEHDKHLPPFVGGGLLPVEVHVGLRYGPEMSELAVQLRPLAPYSALRRWTGPTAVLGLVLHTIEHHPHRYGGLRDLLVVAEALSELDGHGRTALQRSIVGLPTRAAIEASIALAERIRHGDPPRDSRAMRCVAALKYSDLQRTGGGFGLFLRARPLARYLPILLTVPATTSIIRAHLRRRIRPSGWRDSRLARLPHPLKQLGRALLAIWRAQRIAVVALASTAARRSAARPVAAAELMLAATPPSTGRDR
jgi:hypothetical protein